MEDLFQREQHVLDGALFYAEALKNGAAYNINEFQALAEEYAKILKQLRRLTKISDKTATGLNTSNLALLEKVHYDSLTGLYNRRYMEEELVKFIKSISRSGGVLSVIMIDIDYFKKYNDTYGHSTGDECLKQIASALNDCITRTDDFTARFGGEEFIIVLPDTDEKGAITIADRLLNEIRALEIPHKNSDTAPYVTVSVGVTTGRAEHTHGYDQYIRQADRALYLSKQNGRNRYTFVGFEEEKSDNS